MRFGRCRPLTAVQQLVGLQHNPISAGQGRVRLGQLLWDFETRPTPLSRVYTLQIVYPQGRTPRVVVREPDLVALAGGRRLPHVYEQKPPHLCLYLPGTGEWDNSMRISETIVPWAILWLFYFEEWLESDDWKGGGIHPKVHVNGC